MVEDRVLAFYLATLQAWASCYHVRFEVTFVYQGWVFRARGRWHMDMTENEQLEGEDATRVLVTFVLCAHAFIYPHWTRRTLTWIVICTLMSVPALPALSRKVNNRNPVTIVTSLMIYCTKSVVIS